MPSTYTPSGSTIPHSPITWSSSVTWPFSVITPQQVVLPTIGTCLFVFLSSFPLKVFTITSPSCWHVAFTIIILGDRPNFKLRSWKAAVAAEHVSGSDDAAVAMRMSAASFSHSSSEKNASINGS
eukprot:CAMPEP_0119486812 /NCGR_PEP_ID=MMETSP1344-20130328/13099_1 /TAXON_ID=236787 /ORGANISM="Florenciella parvula, Strain CCMP2471" /LENGTH=124 /DNA_ID=CAMNT_0007521609 /DNA_START=190 /DNA_END=567 /DNA_ORIENTATION=+